MKIFILNFSCICAYFFLSTIFLFLLYYFKFLPNETKVRYRFNILDFYLDIIKILSYDSQHYVKGSFQESGIIFYEGLQGSGKTISMVRDVMLLQKKYPKVKVIDNLHYSFSDADLVHPDQLIDFDNDVFGVISAIDECAIWFSNRDYKKFSENSNMLQIIFENRKCRRLLLGTTQKFNLVDKNLRIQCNYVRSCHTILKGAVTFYIEKVPVFDSEGNIQKYLFHGFKFFVQTSDLRKAYDTYHIIRKFKQF